MQGTRVRALVREDPTCHGATKPGLCQDAQPLLQLGTPFPSSELPHNQSQSSTLSPPSRPIPSPHSSTIPSGSHFSQSPPPSDLPSPSPFFSPCLFSLAAGSRTPARVLKRPRPPLGVLTISPRCSSPGYAGFPHSLLSSLPFRVPAPKPAGNWSPGGHGLQLPEGSTVKLGGGEGSKLGGLRKRTTLNSQEVERGPDSAGAQSAPARRTGSWSAASSILARSPWKRD
ncbi:hypothetical protein J1605_016339 [Eschrichtius robustus]|uniref:Uncharacterized protein n=1 Tax=Eschrichtius robustus TaxID=9764 RepID=A0AB34GB40_ESCRO|nr:hypothetical protein J1605_016339 [Eschrichtius robustus]